MHYLLAGLSGLSASAAPETAALVEPAHAFVGSAHPRLASRVALGPRFGERGVHEPAADTFAPALRRNEDHLQDRVVDRAGGRRREERHAYEPAGSVFGHEKGPPRPPREGADRRRASRRSGCAATRGFGRPPHRKGGPYVLRSPSPHNHICPRVSLFRPLPVRSYLDTRLVGIV